MKYYKLLKDTLTVKAGSIFEEEEAFDDEKILVQVTKDGCQFSPWVVVRYIINFDDWFEEIPEKHERWSGGRGDSYYFIDDEGAIRHEIDTNDGMDNYRYNIGNYFKTEAEAESYKKYLTARQVLLDDAEGWKFTLKEQNYFAKYSVIDNRWHLNGDYHYTPGVIYFKDLESLKKSLKEHEEQWEIVRKYEMGEMQWKNIEFWTKK